MNDLFTRIAFSPSRLDATIFIKNQLTKYLNNNSRVLDVGSGGPYLLNLLLELNLNLNYLGIDVHPKKFSFESKNINKKIIKVDFLKYVSNSKFDMIACLWVLEHIKDDTIAMKNISKHMNHDSIAILAVPSIWSWPIEFGRHGFKYYTLPSITKATKDAKLNVVTSYRAGGLLGLIFMIFYSWPRYPVLILALLIFTPAKLLNLTSSWKDFSSKLISRIFYSYQKSEKGLRLHNLFVSKIVTLDNKFKIFPTSYVLILKK